MRYSWRSLLAGVVLSGGLVIVSGTALARSPQAPDNTAANKADRSDNAPTADNAKNDRSDESLMKHIRRDVMRDKSLSTDGHNVKIIAQGGKVTLRGPVQSDEEKKAIEEHAAKYAGSGNVSNELTVKGS